MTRVLALALTGLTGFSGLVYEVAWEKYLATLLGSHSEATAAVLGIFLGGLSVGYATFGKVTRRVVAARHGHRLLGLYGLVEGAIGLYVLAFPTLFLAARTASTMFSHDVFGLGFALDVTLAALLIGPPSVLMGGTIPILTQALSNNTDESTRFHALVYAVNTAGAFAGALAAGFFLVPTLGLVVVMRVMGGVNLVAGAIFVLLGVLRGRTASPAAAPPPGSEATPRIEGFGSYATAAARRDSGVHRRTGSLRRGQRSGAPGPRDHSPRRSSRGEHRGAGAHAVPPHSRLSRRARLLPGRPWPRALHGLRSGRCRRCAQLAHATRALGEAFPGGLRWGLCEASERVRRIDREVAQRRRRSVDRGTLGAGRIPDQSPRRPGGRDPRGRSGAPSPASAGCPR
jgi:hypothetical protein